MAELEPRLSDILTHLASQHGWDRAEWLRRLDVLWHRVVGDTISQHTRILTLTNDGTLLVAVPSSVWSQELTFLKPRILDAIHDELPEIGIRDVRTRVRTDLPYQPRGSEPYRPSPSFRTNPTAPLITDLRVLLGQVQEKYQEAAKGWLRQGFHPCRRCEAPTLKGYLLCIVCELDSRNNS